MMRKANGWVVVTVAAVLGLGMAGCGGGNGEGGGSANHPIGDRAIHAVDVVARAGTFQEPLDAAPSPDGTVIYFIATGDRGPAVFGVHAGGGAVSTVAEGAPLAKPTGVAVATDGSHLYVADQRTTAAGTTGAAGGILTVRTTGARETPTLLPGTQGRSARGLDVVKQGDADLIYFTGTDPVNGSLGLFQVPTAGGTVVTIAEGAPFASPDSVVVTAEGVAFVSDQGSGPGHGQVFRVDRGAVTPVLTNLHLGSPAGVTLIYGDATLLVSSIDAANLSDQVFFLDLATGKTAAATKVIGANKNSSAGLHRAHNASVLAWANCRGQVYRIALNS